MMEVIKTEPIDLITELKKKLFYGSRKSRETYMLTVVPSDYYYTTCLNLDNVLDALEQYIKTGKGTTIEEGEMDNITVFDEE